MKNNKRNLRFGILWADPYCGNLGVAALSYSTIILFEEVSRRTGTRFDYTLWGASRCGVAACSTRDGNGFRSGPYGRFWAAIFPHSQRDVSPTRSGSGRRCSHSIFCGTIWSPTSGPATVIRTFTASPGFRNMDSPNSWARRLRRQYILLPQTIGPYASEEARRKAAGR